MQVNCILDGCALALHIRRRNRRDELCDDYSIVLIGAGLHAAAFLYTLRASGSRLKALVVEKAGHICAQFAQLGDSLVLNSPTFAKVGLNSNLIPGHFVQVSDFDELVERPFPTAKHLHEIASMVLFHADANIRTVSRHRLGVFSHDELPASSTVNASTSSGAPARWASWCPTK